MQPHEQLHQFLLSQSTASTTATTAGAHFLRLLQTNLYNSPHNRDELNRLQACHANSRTTHLSNTNLCFAGPKAHKWALAQLPELAKTYSDTPWLQEGRTKALSPVVRLMTNTTFMEQQTTMRVELPTTPTTTTAETKSTLLIPASSVYDMRRYGPSNANLDTEPQQRPRTRASIRDQLIPNLGTALACWPLVMAGTAVSMATTTTSRGLVAELGPYFGLSSRCLDTGLQLGQDSSRHTNSPSQKDKQPLPFYVAYDTFAGRDNLRSLQHRPTTQWILDEYFAHTNLDANERRPGTTVGADDDDDDNDTSFLFLWERAVRPVYPPAQAVAGRLDPATSDQSNIYQLAQSSAHPQPNQHQQLSLLVIDSAKNAKSWNQQLIAVLGPTPHLPYGSLLVLMDFEFVAIQVKQVYGCLRPYLLPVYISWNQEHWAFVVTHKDGVDLTTTAHRDCYAQIGHDPNTTVARLQDQVTADLQFVSAGLKDDNEDDTTTPTGSSSRADGFVEESHQHNKDDALQKWADVRDELRAHMTQHLREKPEQWMALATL